MFKSLPDWSNTAMFVVVTSAQEPACNEAAILAIGLKLL